MDNKGINPLDVSITAPDYVILAEDTVHVKAIDHNETQVSVSISETVNDMVIVLKVAEEICRMNLTPVTTHKEQRPSNTTAAYLDLHAGACVCSPWTGGSMHQTPESA